MNATRRSDRARYRRVWSTLMVISAKRQRDDFHVGAIATRSNATFPESVEMQLNRLTE